MTRGRSGLAVGAAGLVGLLSACGGEASDLPRDYSSTLTSFEDGGPPVPTASKPAEITAYSTPEELIGAIGAAATAFDSVHVESGTDDGPPTFVGDLTYGTTQDFGGNLEVAPQGAVELRRVGATFYVRAVPTGRWSSIAVDDPRLDRVLDAGVLARYARLDVISDLRTTLLATDGVEDLETSDIAGTPVRAYRLDLDPARLALPTVALPAQVAGSVTAELSLDADDLPVRLDVEYRPGLVSRVDFSGWGEPVSVAAPAPAQVQAL